MLGFVIFGLVIFGLVMFGLVMSGLSTVEPLNPFVTAVPPIPEIWVTFTVTLAAALVDVTKTLRETDEYCGMVNCSVVRFANCKKEADPPVG